MVLTMRFRLALSQEQKPVPHKLGRQFNFGSQGKAVDRRRLLDQIEAVTQNSEGRVKAIEVNRSSHLYDGLRNLFFFIVNLESGKVTHTSLTLQSSVGNLETRKTYIRTGD